MIIQQYILVVKAAGLPIDVGGALFVDLLVLLANLGFGMWIMIALMGLLGILKRNGERAALLFRQYVRFFVAFFVMCVIAIIVFIAEAYDPTPLSTSPTFLLPWSLCSSPSLHSTPPLPRDHLA